MTLDKFSSLWGLHFYWRRRRMRMKKKSLWNRIFKYVSDKPESQDKEKIHIDIAWSKQWLWSAWRRKRNWFTVFFIVVHVPGCDGSLVPLCCISCIWISCYRQSQVVYIFRSIPFSNCRVPISTSSTVALGILAYFFSVPGVEAPLIPLCLGTYKLLQYPVS